MNRVPLLMVSMRIKLDNICKASSKEAGNSMCINYTIYVSRFCQRPIVPGKVKWARKILLKTIEISLWAMD